MKKLIVKPITEENREYLERRKKQFEENCRQIYEEVKQNRANKYTEIKEGNELKRDRG